MAFNPFIELDDSEVSKLGFDFTRHPYMYYNENYGIKRGEIFKITQNVYKKITKLMHGNENTIINKKDKVFVCPGCKLPLYRVKEYLRTLGATITRDIEKATIILSTNNICENVDNSYKENKQARLGKLFFEDDGMYSIKKEEKLSLSDYTDISDMFDNKITDTKEIDNVMFSNLVKDHMSFHSCFIRNFDFDSQYYLYPISIKIIYEILSKKIPIIHEDIFCLNANSGLKLNDEDTFNNIIMMLDSADSKDVEMAKEMISNSDFSDADHQLYYLAQNYYYKLTSSKNKNHKYFVDESNLGSYYLMNDFKFIKYLKDNDNLSVEKFKEKLQKFVEECLNDVSHTTYKEMFNIRISLKEEWLNFVNKEDKNLNYELNNDDDD